ncbi:unnamed protein product [Leuciscus chuanchicus]
MMNMVFCRGRDKGFISDRTIWRPFQSAVAGQGGDTCKVGQAGDGTADKPAHQVSQADKSHDESRQGLQGDTEELPGPLRRDFGLGVSFPVALLAQTSSDNLPSE